MSLLFALALVIFLIQLLTLLDIAFGLHRMERLRDVVVQLEKEPPLVSVIVPACNEAETLEPALLALLAQDYRRLEVIVVNDRSTDTTGEILQRLQEKSQRSFEILTIQELPAGWLGKPHALQVGAASAAGDILLFTDADIEMDKTTISRAVTVFTARQLDHLCLMFQAIGGNWLLNAMILDSASGLLALFKPWKAGEPTGRYFIGVGAFNMVRAKAYSAVEGHSRIPMHPIDDIMLGKLLKEHGCRQLCLLGQPLVRVCWYSSVSDMIEGLMKNVFSVLHYRVWLALLGVLALFAVNVLPLLGVVFAAGAARFVFGSIVALRLVGFLVGACFSGMRLTVAFGGLLAPLINIYIVALATCRTIRDQGIYWRGSHYPLAELKKSRPLFF